MRHNQYRITLERINLDEGQAPEKLSLEIEDREDIFARVEGLKKGTDLTPDEATRLTLAIRLLGPMMMEKRKHPLFVNFMPHFKDFMQNLKATVKARN